LDVDDDFHEWEMAGRTQCHVCLQWFLTEGRARDHLYEAHLQFDNAEAASRVECDCGNLFKDEAMLALHLKLDHHECALCRKRFSSPAALEGHRRDHVRPSPALLEVKAKPAEKVQPSNVKSPWRPPSLTVNKSKNVKTAPPSKQPSSNVSKAKNVRIEPRKFQCSYCHFSYGAERLLKRHADQKHPQCLKCPHFARFVSQEALVEHEKEHHYLECYDCHEKLEDKNRMEKHLARVHLECLICGDRASNQSMFDFHRRECRDVSQFGARAALRKGKGAPGHHWW